LIPFVGYHWNSELVAEMLFFSFTSIPYGALATRLWMTSRTGLRNVADSLALGIAMVMGIELCQLFVQSRFTDATQVVMGAAGVLVGVLLMHGLWPQSAGKEAESRTWLQAPGIWFTAAMLYVFIPAAFLLWPYEFVFDGATVRQELLEMFGIPFDRLLRHSPLPISTIVIRDLVLYWPLGLLLGAGIRRTKSTWRPMFILLGAVSVVSIAFGIEVLQSLVPQRHADFTEVLLSSVAGVAGMGGLVLRTGASWWTFPRGRISTGKT
jgi:glycopeptide antibiotics resistance protein